MRAFHVLGFCVGLIACSAVCSEVRAQQQSADETATQLVAPELILQFKDRLNLTQSQHDAIQSMVATVKEKLAATQQQLKAESQGLRDALRDNLSDEKAVLGQLDKVIAQERNIRRLQLALVIRVYQRLDAQQLADAQQISLDLVNQRRVTKQRIESKFQQAVQLVQQRNAEGNPPTEVVELMRPFAQLLKDGKVQEAESLLDQAMAKLKPDNITDLFPDSELLPKQ